MIPINTSGITINSVSETPSNCLSISQIDLKQTVDVPPEKEKGHHEKRAGEIKRKRAEDVDPTRQAKFKASSTGKENASRPNFQELIKGYRLMSRSSSKEDLQLWKLSEQNEVSLTQFRETLFSDMKALEEDLVKEPMKSNHEVAKQAVKEYAELVAKFFQKPNMHFSYTFDKRDRDLLQLACQKGYRNIVFYLLQLPDIDPCVQDHRPLENAVSNRHKEVVKVLLQNSRVLDKTPNDRLRRATGLLNERETLYAQKQKEKQWRIGKDD